MRHFKFKIKLPLIIVHYLFIVFLCTSCTTSTNTIDETEANKEIVFKENNYSNTDLHDMEVTEEMTVQKYTNTRIYLLDDGIKIDGKLTYRGQELDVKSGLTKITFHGTLLLSVSTKPKDSNVQETAEAVDFLTCLAFLPICALTRDNILPKKTIAREFHSECSGNADIIIQAGIEYSVSMVELVDAMPLLIVTRITEPSHNILEQELTCIDT